MKTKSLTRSLSIVMVLFMTFPLTQIVAQEKSKKQLKEERKLEKQKQIALLVDSKEFVFDATTVFPQGGRSIQLTTEYTVEFHPDLIKSYLPYFGRGFRGVGYGGDNGMKFEGKPENYSLVKTKKGYDIKTDVKVKNETYAILLNVYFEGSAYLSINTNNRSSISYSGTIIEFKKE